MANEDESIAVPARHEMEGEILHGVDPESLKQEWRTIINNVIPLLPRDHDLMFEGRDKDQERIEILLPVEHGMDKKKKVIITVAAATALTALGIGVIMRGRFSPKSRK